MWYVWAIGIGLFVWLIISNIRIAKLQRMLGQLETHIKAFEKQTTHMKSDFAEQFAAAQREYDLKLANAVQEWLNTRQRWTLTASQLLIAKNWIRMMVDSHKTNNLPIPLPPNVEELHRGDESVYFTEIERATEYRLDDLVKEAIDANAAFSNTTP